jgi:hypothetical protein
MDRLNLAAVYLVAVCCFHSHSHRQVAGMFVVGQEVEDQAEEEEERNHAARTAVVEVVVFHTDFGRTGSDWEEGT